VSGVAVFEPIASAADHAAAVAGARGAGRPVPVLVAGRRDLEQSVALANRLYGAVVAPRPADVGVRVGGEVDVDGSWVVRGLAGRWVGEDELPAVVREVAAGSVERPLVAGVYARLTSGLLHDLLEAAERRPGAGVGVISGRDAATVGWMAAKQWAAPRPDVTDCGLLSDVTAFDDAPGVTVWGPSELRRDDAGRALLAARWRSLMLYGHAADDHVVLGRHTICGRNDAAAGGGGDYRPQCGYGAGCFAAEAGLIDARRIAAVELVLNGCHTGSLADMAPFEHRYSLLLNALDGAAQRVSAAMAAHHASHPDAAAWADEVRAWALAAGPGSAELASARHFATTLRSHLPGPVFWHFGMPPRTLVEPRPAPRPAPDILTIGRRAHALQAPVPLPPGHPVRGALAELDDLLSRYLDRDELGRDARRGGQLAGRIRASAAAIDAAIAERIRTDPEDDLMGVGEHAFQRGALDPGSVRAEPCGRCGHAAQRFTVEPHLPTLVPVTCVLCARCGEVELAMAGGPRLAIEAPARIAAGGSARIAVTVCAPSDGAVWLGVFVSPRRRGVLRVTPDLERVEVRAGAAATVAGRLCSTDEAPPKECYVRAFAVSNLGLGTARRRFQIIPGRVGDVEVA
jgi:hypothetical protein